jgi:hypothetical protein
MQFQFEFWQLNESELHILYGLLSRLNISNLAAAYIRFIFRVLEVKYPDENHRAQFSVEVGVVA